MKHKVSIPHPPFPVHIAGRATPLTVHQVPSWEDNFIWLIVDAERGQALAVDGPEASSALAACEALECELVGILNTHVHPDHIGINKDLEKSGRLDGLRVIGSASRADDVPGIKERVVDGDTVDIFGHSATVLLTEGHQNGHVSYLLGDTLFCGDTLFAGGCGYLFDGPPRKMHDSLQRLAALPDETRVCCAHEYTEDNLRFACFVDEQNEDLTERVKRVAALRGEGRASVPSTIAEERTTNPFLRTEVEAIRALLRTKTGTEPENSEETFAALRALKNTGSYKAC